MGGGGMLGSIVQSASAGLQAIVGNNAIDKASNAQVNAARDAKSDLANQYGQTQGYLKPYQEAGTAALAQLQSQFGTGGKTFSMADFQQDPGYAFRLAEGQKALERSGAARGMTLSGAQAKALMSYGQGAASQEYSNAYNRFNNDQNTLYSRLYGQSQLGLNAAGQGANLSNAYGNALAGATSDIGNAEAAGTMAKYRNWQTQDSRAAGAWGASSGSGSGSNSGSSSSGFGQWLQGLGG